MGVLATLKEIADKVGVSVATVSRVLNNDTGILVADETKIEIFQVAEQLQYQTMRQRKNKVKKKENIKIGIADMYDVTQQLEDPYYLLLRNIVEKLCFEKEIEVFKLYYQNDTYEMVGDIELNGIIAIGKFSKSQIERLRDKTPYIVFLDSSPDDEQYDSVKINFKLGLYQALNHLVEMGHTHIGFIGERYTLGDLKIPVLDDRLKFFYEYMQKQTLLKEEYIINSNMTSSGGYQAVRDYIEKGNKLPTAFFAANDAIATGVIRAIQEKGYRIPEDISVIGFNDTIVSQYMNPPLTSVRVHIEWLAETSVQLIGELIAGRSYAKKVILPSELIVRQSVQRMDR